MSRLQRSGNSGRFGNNSSGYGGGGYSGRGNYDNFGSGGGGYNSGNNGVNPYSNSKFLKFIH